MFSLTSLLTQNLFALHLLSCLISSVKVIEPVGGGLEYRFLLVRAFLRRTPERKMKPQMYRNAQRASRLSRPLLTSPRCAAAGRRTALSVFLIAFFLLISWLQCLEVYRGTDRDTRRILTVSLSQSLDLIQNCSDGHW